MNVTPVSQPATYILIASSGHSVKVIPALAVIVKHSGVGEGVNVGVGVDVEVNVGVGVDVEVIVGVGVDVEVIVGV